MAEAELKNAVDESHHDYSNIADSKSRGYFVARVFQVKKYSIIRKGTTVELYVKWVRVARLYMITQRCNK